MTTAKPSRDERVLAMAEAAVSTHTTTTWTVIRLFAHMATCPRCWHALLRGEREEV